MEAFTNIVLDNEPTLRLGFFGGVLALMMGWEVLAPRRNRAVSRWRRWPGNLGIGALKTLLARFAFSAVPVGVAALAVERGWGLW
ncbi:MAG: sterol desaturase family protein, partial [Bdellovibrionales bacterium]